MLKDVKKMQKRTIFCNFAPHFSLYSSFLCNFALEMCLKTK